MTASTGARRIHVRAEGPAEYVRTSDLGNSQWDLTADGTTYRTRLNSHAGLEAQNVRTDDELTLDLTARGTISGIHNWTAERRANPSGPVRGR